MASLYRCIFEWDQQDLDSLYAAKRQELIANGIKNPSSEAVRRAVGKKELALHSRRRTRGAEATENLLDSLLTTMAPATECWVYPCSGRRCWARFGQNKRNMSPAYDPPPGIQLYVRVGSSTKGGKSLPVYRCARGTTSLESFHNHLARSIPGESDIAYVIIE